MKPTTFVLAAGVALAAWRSARRCMRSLRGLPLSRLFSGGPQYPPAAPIRGAARGRTVTAVIRDTGRETTR